MFLQVVDTPDNLVGKDGQLSSTTPAIQMPKEMPKEACMQNSDNLTELMDESAGDKIRMSDKHDDGANDHNPNSTDLEASNDEGLLNTSYSPDLDMEEISATDDLESKSDDISVMDLKLKKQQHNLHPYFTSVDAGTKNFDYVLNIVKIILSHNASFIGRRSEKPRFLDMTMGEGGMVCKALRKCVTVVVADMYKNAKNDPHNYTDVMDLDTLIESVDRRNEPKFDMINLDLPYVSKEGNYEAWNCDFVNSLGSILQNYRYGVDVKYGQNMLGWMHAERISDAKKMLKLNGILIVKSMNTNDCHLTNHVEQMCLQNGFNLIGRVPFRTNSSKMSSLNETIITQGKISNYSIFQCTRTDGAPTATDEFGVQAYRLHQYSKIASKRAKADILKALPLWKSTINMWHYLSEKCLASLDVKDIDVDSFGTLGKHFTIKDNGIDWNFSHTNTNISFPDLVDLYRRTSMYRATAANIAGVFFSMVMELNARTDKHKQITASGGKSKEFEEYNCKLLTTLLDGSYTLKDINSRTKGGGDGLLCSRLVKNIAIGKRALWNK